MSEPLVYDQLAGKKIHRLEAVTDGVFAIALTLLVLDIKVPISESIQTEKDIIHALGTLTPKFLSYFLSFITLGIFWTAHSAHYTFIEHSDRHLNWLCLFFLLFVSVLPFTTAFLSEHIEFRISIALYWLNIFFLGLTMFFHWVYAYNHHCLNLPENKRRMVDRAIRRRGFVAQGLYAIGAVLCFMNNYVSITFIICVQLYFAIGLGFGKRRESPIKSAN